MKKIATLFVACALVLSAGAANAVTIHTGWDYDVVGHTDLTPPISFNRDGLVTLGMDNWWEDDLYTCYYTFKYPQYLQYFGDCDFDGNGDVAWHEIMEMYEFVIQFPTGSYPGYADYTYFVVPLEECADHSHVNFFELPGPPLPLGAVYVNHECTFVFGSGTNDPVWYFSSVKECEDTCFGCFDNADCDAGEYCKFADFACGRATRGTCEPVAEMCYQVYEPVCDCNGNTRSNNCAVAQDWTPSGGLPAASIDYNGECE